MDVFVLIKFFVLCLGSRHVLLYQFSFTFFLSQRLLLTNLGLVIFIVSFSQRNICMFQYYYYKFYYLNKFLLNIYASRNQNISEKSFQMPQESHYINHCISLFTLITSWLLGLFLTNATRHFWSIMRLL